MESLQIRSGRGGDETFNLSYRVHRLCLDKNIVGWFHFLPLRPAPNTSGSENHPITDTVDSDGRTG